MFISIVIPTYNAQDSIAKCLDSIVNQGFLDYEIILINDGSTDDSNSIICEYIKNHSDVKIIYKVIENQGPGVARNIGISLANGDYIWFVDADDEVEIHSLNIIEKTIKESNCDILRFSCRIVENEKTIRKEMEFIEDIYEENKLEPFVNEALSRSWAISMTCWQHIYKKELIKDIPFIIDNKPYGEDVLFNSLVYPKAKSIQIIADILYIYNKRSNSLSHTKNKNLLFKTLNYYHIVKDYYISINIWDKYKDAILTSFGDFAILGGGKKKKGAIYFTYNAFDNFFEAYDYIGQIVSFNKFQEFVKDALSRKNSEYFSNLYSLLEKRDVINAIAILSDDSNDEDIAQTKKDENEIVFLSILEITDISDYCVAVPVGDTSRSFVINLNKESANVLKYLIETKRVDKTLECLYQDYKNEDKVEIKDNLLDFISKLKSQKVIK